VAHSVSIAGSGDLLAGLADHDEAVREVAQFRSAHLARRHRVSTAAGVALSETDYSNSTAAQLISSHQVNWWTVHLYFERLRALLGAQHYPAAGTPAWCRLDDSDPLKLIAVLDYGQHHALRVDTAQEVQCTASRVEPFQCSGRGGIEQPVAIVGALDAECGPVLADGGAFAALQMAQPVPVTEAKTHGAEQLIGTTRVALTDDRVVRLIAGRPEWGTGIAPVLRIDQGDGFTGLKSTLNRYW
jgi:hypothetical protein